MVYYRCILGELSYISLIKNYDILTFCKTYWDNDIACDTIEYAKMHNHKAVKKTLTIPEWLNEEATALGINFSQVLQEALIQKIGVKL